jgi:MarR-like DNA-binding transcriptional regulator SgrR of sgrS sRNA
MLRGCEEWLADEQVLLFLYTTRHETQYHPSLQGMVSDFFGWDHFRHLWFKDVSI